MKRQTLWALRLGSLVLLTGAVLWLNQGCTGKSPVAAVFAIPPKTPLPDTLIDNLEDGDTIMSIDLRNGASAPTTVIEYVQADPSDPSSPMVAQAKVNPSVPLGSWVASSWAGNSVNNPYVFCGGGGANGTSCFIHLFGSLTEPPIPPGGRPAYASYQLEGKLNGGRPYNASTFTGVRFYYKATALDQCSAFRRFDIAIEQTLPQSEGGNGFCVGNSGPDQCNDHFGYSFTGGDVNGNWIQKTFTFASLMRRNFGKPVAGNLTNFTANFVKLTWQHGLNGTPGTAYVDYYVDEVEFF